LRIDCDTATGKEQIMLSKEELDRIAAADEKRLGVGSKEFMQQHNEIMELIDRARGKGVAADGKADYERPGCYGSAGSV